MRTFESDPMQSGIARAADALCGKEAVAEVCLGRRARADDCAGRGEEVELGAVRVGRMHDRRALGEAAGARQQLDRAAAVLGEALLDLLRLLVGMDVERELVLARVPPDLLEPVGGARADGVGGDPDAQPGIPEPLDLLEEFRDRLLAEAGETSARVGDMEEDELDPRGCSGLGCRQCFDEAEVVELADRRVPGGEHLLVAQPVASRTSSGVWRSASASITSRHAQKSPPAARPRSARWNVWLCAFTKPGIRSVPATARR